MIDQSTGPHELGCALSWRGDTGLLGESCTCSTGGIPIEITDQGTDPLTPEFVLVGGTYREVFDAQAVRQVLAARASASTSDVRRLTRLNRTYTDGKVTLDADAFDDAIEGLLGTRVCSVSTWPCSAEEHQARILESEELDPGSEWNLAGMDR